MQQASVLCLPRYKTTSLRSVHKLAEYLSTLTLTIPLLLFTTHSDSITLLLQPDMPLISWTQRLRACRQAVVYTCNQWLSHRRPTGCCQKAAEPIIDLRGGHTGCWYTWEPACKTSLGRQLLAIVSAWLHTVLYGSPLANHLLPSCNELTLLLAHPHTHTRYYTE